MGFYGYGNTVPSMIDKYIGTEYDNVKKVADNIEDIKAVADGMDEMEIIIDNIEPIILVGENIESVIAVAGDIENVNIVATNIDDVNVVAQNYQDVGLVADAITSNTVTIKTPEDTGATYIPVGNDADRPATPVVGMVRYNTDDQGFEGYSNEGWDTLGGSSTFSGEFPPEEAKAGSTWFCTSNGLSYIYLDDGDSVQWVEANPNYPSASGAYSAEDVGALPITGGTLQGQLTIDPVSTGQNHLKFKGRPINDDNARGITWTPHDSDVVKGGIGWLTENASDTTGTMYFGIGNNPWFSRGIRIEPYLTTLDSDAFSPVELYGTSPTIKFKQTDVADEFFMIADSDGIRVQAESSTGPTAWRYYGTDHQLETAPLRVNPHYNTPAGANGWRLNVTPHGSDNMAIGLNHIPTGGDQAPGIGVNANGNVYLWTKTAGSAGYSAIISDAEAKFYPAVVQIAAQGTTANHLTRKDYVDTTLLEVKNELLLEIDNLRAELAALREAK